MPEAMGCTCMQRIPVRQSNTAGSCASGVWGWDLSWTVIKPSLGFDLSLNPYRRCQFWCAYQALLTVGPCSEQHLGLQPSRQLPLVREELAGAR